VWNTRPVTVTKLRASIGPLTTLLVAGWMLGACSSEGQESFAPAAEPAESPPLTAVPAGEVAILGVGVEGMIFHPRSDSVAVAVREPYRLAFVDPEKLFITRQYPIPNPARHLGLSPDGRRVLVPAESANELFEIPNGPGRVIRVATGEHPHDAVSADGKVFVADEFGDTVTVLGGNRVLETLPAPEQPGGIAAVGNRYVVVATVAERVLRVYDAATGEVLGETGAGVGPTHIDTIGQYAYVADTEGDMIRKFLIGPEPREVAAVPAEGTPYGIAIDRRRKRLWVTLTATNQLVGYSIAGDTPIAEFTYPTVRQPNTVAVNPANGDVFVGSRSDAQIQRISPARSQR
jgi:DNA-binding beta-propeller fold protein YncE